MITYSIHRGFDISGVYDKFLAKGMEAIASKCNHNIDHVSMCNELVECENSFVVLFFNEDDYVGFANVILDNGEYQFFIYKAWAVEHMHCNTKECIDILSSIAKGLGFAYISFGSPRKGWLRAAGNYGFEVMHTIYKRCI